jgi:hypothetical protein
MSTRSRTNTSQTNNEPAEGQLRLLAGGSVGAPPEWHLDERTRIVGLLGVEQAREVLRQARPPEPKHPEPIRKAS